MVGISHCTFGSDNWRTSRLTLRRTISDAFALENYRCGKVSVDRKIEELAVVRREEITQTTIYGRPGCRLQGSAILIMVLLKMLST